MEILKNAQDTVDTLLVIIKFGRISGGFQKGAPQGKSAFYPGGFSQEYFPKKMLVYLFLRIFKRRGPKEKNYISRETRNGLRGYGPKYFLN